MGLDVRVPEVGESVQEAVLAEWFKKDGEQVAKDEALFLLETDKITLEVAAEDAGVLRILVQGGATVAAGDVVGKIEAGGVDQADGANQAEEADGTDQTDQTDGTDGTDGSNRSHESSKSQKPTKPQKPTEPEEPSESPGPAKPTKPTKPAKPAESDQVPPTVLEPLQEHGLEASEVPATGPGGRPTRNDVLLFLEQRDQDAPVDEPPQEKSSTQPAPKAPASASPPIGQPQDDPCGATEEVTRKAIPPIRKRIAERLLQAKHSTAMLTTFNEIDMGEVMALRGRYKEAFLTRHGVKLGITSFFVKAVVEALKAFPLLNAMIEGDEIVEHHYYHIGVAVGAERGLVVPVLRHADRRTFAELEQGIATFVEKIKGNRLALKDLEGGTFSITNGGVFGSLLSTPILNYPQCGILGLHKVEERPVAVDGKVVVRPMMYVALSYDHRIVDGREAVQFLTRVKAIVEDPERLLVEV